MVYTSLHRCIRNIPSDTEVHAEHQLRVDRSTCPGVKNIQNHARLSSRKELERKIGVLQDWTCSWWVGELEQGSDPHTGVIV